MVNTRAWLAEAIATFALVFFGPLSVILAVVVFGDGTLSTEAIIMISLGHGGAIASASHALVLTIKHSVRDFNINNCIGIGS